MGVHGDGAPHAAKKRNLAIMQQWYAVIPSCIGAAAIPSLWGPQPIVDAVILRSHISAG